MCFPARTEILMWPGVMTRYIENVSTADEVVLAEGGRGVVTNTMVRKEKDGMVRMRFPGPDEKPAIEVLATRGQKFLTQSEGYVRAGQFVDHDHFVRVHEDGCRFRRTKGCAFEKYDDAVYNIEVAMDADQNPIDGSFVANGVGVKDWS